MKRTLIVTVLAAAFAILTTGAASAASAPATPAQAPGPMSISLSEPRSFADILDLDAGMSAFAAEILGTD